MMTHTRGFARVVAIGVSTGGPQALSAILPSLPANFPVPILVVQHMPPVFTQQLAARLDHECEVEVKEAAHGDVLHAGVVYIAPGDFHMTIRRNGPHALIVLDQGAPEHSCRPAVNPMLRSVAHVYGQHVAAFILTGMGSDGRAGCEDVRRHGGYVVAQSRASSTVWGMPGAVSEAGLAHRVLPRLDMAGEMIRCTGGTPMQVPTRHVSCMRRSTA